jgi:hypothetical protein
LQRCKRSNYWRVSNDLKYCKECYEFVRSGVLGFDELSDELKAIEMHDHARLECTHECEECKALRSSFDHKCLRCGHEWTSSEDRDPDICPHCKSKYWNEADESKIPRGGGSHHSKNKRKKEKPGSVTSLRDSSKSSDCYQSRDK